MRSNLPKFFGGHSSTRASAWKILVLAIALCGRTAIGQSILFDFNNVPARSPLPLVLSSGSFVVQLTATGQGFGVQAADIMGFTPVGFSGNCIYPSSIYASDLQVSFSQPMTFFSILYAPQELACDSSATMKVTAYLKGVAVGSATTNAQSGTWPTETLAITNAGGFDSVVVHYEAPPVTGGDWGPIFMADNMVITPAAQPAPSIVLQNPTMLPGGDFQFSFTNNPSAVFLVWAATDVSLPLSQWSYLGYASEIAPGGYQFTDVGVGGVAQRFYCVQRQ